MANKVFALLVLFAISTGFCCNGGPFTPDWTSLDNRPLPAWFDQAKIGIFIHWGVFSVPSFGSEWFWNNWKEGSPYYVDFMKANYKPSFTYADFAKDFTAEFFNATQWVEVFKAAGARYVVMTTKHHEGYNMWPSNYSFNWNSMQVGPKRDLVGELAAAVRGTSDIRFGLYHSLYEFFNPLYLRDKANKWQTQDFVKMKTMPELYELINTYKPEVLWSDGQWEAPDSYWNSTNFLAWLYNDSPVKDTIVTNDRWGNDTECAHGGYFTCEDRYNPGKLQSRKWENAMTLDSGSWGYRRDVDFSSYLTLKQLITTLAETISCGGNLLMNVGPTKDGRIMPIFEERLRELGAWLSINGEAIYDSTPWLYQNDTYTPQIWYTQRKDVRSLTGYSVYAIMLEWPNSNLLPLQAPEWTPNTNIYMLGWDEPLRYTSTSVQDILLVHLPQIPYTRMPSLTAWVLRFENLMY